MAITAEAREQIITLVVGMFNAAPGATILDALVDAYEGGASIDGIAAALATKSQFNDVFPAHQTSEEFADTLVANLLGDEVSAEAKEWSTNWVVTNLNAGMSRDQVIVSAVRAILTTENENYADAKTALANKVEVATYYSVEKNLSSNDLGDLQSVVVDVTSDEASVVAAKAEVDERDAETGETFVLTVGPNDFQGTSDNDTFDAQNINDQNAAATTFTSFDKLDGGAGKDTLNIYADGAENMAFPGSASVENIEVVNIYNDGAAANLGDASKFVGVEELVQIGDAVAVTNLAETTTAGFEDIVAGALDVTAVKGAASASVELGNVDDVTTLTVAALNTLNLTGSVVDGGGPTAGVDALAVVFDLGTGQKTATVNSSVAIDLAFGAVVPESIDASGSTGGITTVVALATSDTVSSSVKTGEGDDVVTVNTSGTGTTSVDVGAGDDTVDLASDGTGTLTVKLGAGVDTFTASGGAVSAGDVIDGGADADTLLLSIVGVANIGAFQNFEGFDAIGLGKNLDVDILSSKNTVTEITTTGDVGAGAALANLGAGVGYRVIADDTAAAYSNALTLTQKTAGALTVGVDIDETGTTAATTVAGDVEGSVAAVNATAITVNFDSDFVEEAQAAGDNLAEFGVNAAAATSLTVVSGGENAVNHMLYQDPSDKLTSVTVSGDSALTLDIVSATSKVATVDASALTGGLTFDTASLKLSTVGTFDGGVVKLGAGDDVITVSTQGAKIAGIGLGDGEGADSADGGFDLIASATAQAADATTADVELENGLATFLNAGPNDLATAIAQVSAAAGGDAAVFEYIGNSYVVDAGTVVQLVGVTGLEGLDADASGNGLYVF